MNVLFTGATQHTIPHSIFPYKGLIGRGGWGGGGGVGGNCIWRHLEFWEATHTHVPRVPRPQIGNGNWM